VLASSRPNVPPSRPCTPAIASWTYDRLRYRGRVRLERVDRPDRDQLDRILQHDGRLTQLGDAIAGYGRIFKTLHVLTFVDDPACRRQLKAMRNLQEGPPRAGPAHLPWPQG
jgi:TnpA family transposase